mmetsp:Transcript_12397/g.32794  ORF Transcript_12397/g.32794 Transcript_12397/m.32794 type:complete len:520 (+) Transcript_12397:1596-3155(+)
MVREPVAAQQAELLAQLARRDRDEVRRVRLGDACAVLLEQPRARRVEALRGELVVAERAEQLGDDEVGFHVRAPLAHVRAHDGDVVPREPRGGLGAAQRQQRVRVLLDGVDFDALALRFRGGERGLHERPAARAEDEADDGLGDADLRARHVGGDGVAVHLVLDGVLLEGFVGLGLEVVAERLQRGLEVVVVRRLEAVGLGGGVLLAEEVAEVLDVLLEAFVGGFGGACLGAAGEDEVGAVGKQHLEECLVVLGEHGVALLVLDERGGRENHEAHGLREPAVEHVARRDVRADLEGDGDVGVRVDEVADGVPGLPRVGDGLFELSAGGFDGSDGDSDPDLGAARVVHCVEQRVGVIRDGADAARRRQHRRPQRQMARQRNFLRQRLRRARPLRGLRGVKVHPRGEFPDNRRHPFRRRQKIIRSRERIIARRRVRVEGALIAGVHDRGEDKVAARGVGLAERGVEVGTGRDIDADVELVSGDLVRNDHGGGWGCERLSGKPSVAQSRACDFVGVAEKMFK